MFKLIIQNIKDFFDFTVFFVILGIGFYTILVDYRYFKRIKFTKDAAVTMIIGVAFIVLPFLLLVISRL